MIRCSLQELVELMYHPESPPLDWDDKGAYTQDRVEMYYLRNAATPLPLEKLAEVMASMAVAGDLHANMPAATAFLLSLSIAAEMIRPKPATCSTSAAKE